MFMVTMVVYPVKMASDLPDRVKATGVDLSFYTKADTEEELISLCKDADYIISMQGHFPFTSRVFKELPKCRFFQTLSIGCDKLDIKTATEQGIGIINLRGFCVEELAEQAMALMLSFARWIAVTNHRMKTGRIVSPADPEAYRNMSILKGKTLGLIGFGGSGRSMVPKARGFEMNIMAYDPYTPVNIFDKFQVEKVDLDTLLQKSDFVSVHASLTDDTKHLISFDQFKKMKKNAFIVNTARGPIIDEQALCQALNEGYIAGAGLDTTEQEPVPADSPLLKYENVILTGHNAGNSPEAIMNTAIFPVQELTRVLNGEWPRGLVNPEVKAKFSAKWGALREPKEME
jgi:D-3-phosphoglycerate dehydrogenase / 2-oxoglutarate reductase